MATSTLINTPVAINSTSVNVNNNNNNSKNYKYSIEISQMCYVFEQGYSQLEEEVVHFIEDVVKSQLLEIVLQARSLASRRGIKSQVSVEDLIFLIRHDKAKMNRLRTYLSWKDVRKNCKEVEDSEVPELDAMAESASDKGLKVNKLKTKIPWDLTSIFSEHINDDSDGENDDEVEAYEASKKRLKQADDRTRAMTREQYTHFTECRQASFTYRKGKRFRDFINIPTSFDGPSDEIIDVLGFLAYEMVRSLCEASSQYKQGLSLSKATASVASLKEQRKEEEARSNLKGKGKGKGREKKRDRDATKEGGDSTGKNDMEVDKEESKSQLISNLITHESPAKSRRFDSTSNNNSTKSPPHFRTDPISLFSESLDKPVSLLSGMTTPGGGIPSSHFLNNGSIGSDRLTLGLGEVSAAYDEIQMSQMALKANGMKNWRGGLKRFGLGLI